MKKWYTVFILLVFVLIALAGCGESKTDSSPGQEDEPEVTEEAGNSSFPVTITDALEEKVVVEEKPERIVSLVPGNTEIAFALGLGDFIVGVSDHDNYPEEVFEIEKVGGMEFDIEKIIALEPDIVLAHESSALNSIEGLEQIKNSGIAVLVVNEANSFDDVYQSIELIGKATGTEEQAATIIGTMQNEVEKIKEKAAQVSEKKSVLFEISPAPEIYAAGKNTFMDEMLSIINADNAAGDLEGWPKLDEEVILEYNPDVIVTTYGFYVDHAIEDVKAREGWQDVTAIKNGEVYDVHSDLLSRPGPRLIDGVKELAQAVYPDIFNE